MKKLVLFLMSLTLVLNSSAQTNITFKSNLAYPNDALSNIGGYVDSLGNEYALVGYESGLSIVDVTNPAAPVEVFTVPGTNSIWREVKTMDNYAYVTTEGCCNGLQIVNLGYLPDSIQFKQWTGGAPLNDQLETIHALHVDGGHAYLYGCNLYNGTALICDLADPWNPVYKGHTPGTYIHDGYVRNDTLYSAHIYGGYFSVFDVTDKTNPVLLATQSTPTQFTHNLWLNDAGTAIFTTDENTNSFLGSYDITDLNNITELDRVQLTPGSGSIIHNTHTLNDFEIISWYKDGIAIVDVSRPDNMIITGQYDTYLQGSGNGFNGAWGVYPYLPSGTIVVSDIDNGLYVLTPTYVRGCYLEGLVTDTNTTLPLNNVTVTILGPSIVKNTKITGLYKTGLAAAGTYDVSFSKAGYITKTITGIVLQNGVLTNLDVQLNTIVSTVTVTGTVVETGTGNPIANATVNFENAQFNNTITTNQSGQFTIPGFFQGVYNLTVGHWGHRTFCSSNQNANGSNPFNISLDKGYYDDFVLDFGWAVSGPSGNLWERDAPIATTNQGQTANPGADINSDCGNFAFVTDNGGGSPWDNDVDQGSTILTSPIFDMSTYLNPHVNYNRWFYNGGTTNGQPDDSMKIYLTNGTNTVLIEALGPTSSSSLWVPQSKAINSYLTPNATMQFIVNIGDPGPVFNIVEGGLDKFEIVEVVGIDDNNSIANIKLSASPNPFSNQVMVSIHSLEQKSTLQIFDMSGRLTEERMISTLGNQNMMMGESWSNGVYMARLISGKNISSPIKLVKK